MAQPRSPAEVVASVPPAQVPEKLLSPTSPNAALKHEKSPTEPIRRASPKRSLFVGEKSEYHSIHPPYYWTHALFAVVALAFLVGLLASWGWKRIHPERPAVVALGPHGAGKSLLGNLLAGKAAFKLNQTVLEEPKKCKVTHLRVENFDYIDCPSLCKHSKVDRFDGIEQYLKRENRASAFLIVLNGAEQNASVDAVYILQKILRKFGAATLNRTAFVFTHVTNVDKQRKAWYHELVGKVLSGVGNKDAHLPSVFAFDLHPIANADSHSGDWDLVNKLNKEDLKALRDWISKHNGRHSDKVAKQPTGIVHETKEKLAESLERVEAVAEHAATFAAHKAQEKISDVGEATAEKLKEAGHAAHEKLHEMTAAAQQKSAAAAKALRENAADAAAASGRAARKVRRTVAQTYDSLQKEAEEAKAWREAPARHEGKWARFVSWLTGRKPEPQGPLQQMYAATKHAATAAAERGKATEKAVEAAASHLGEAAREAGSRVKATAKEAVGAAHEMGEAVAGATRRKAAEVKGVAKEAGDYIADKAEDVKEYAKDAGDYIYEKAEEAKEYLHEASDYAYVKAGEAQDAVRQKLEKAHLVEPRKKSLWKKIFG